jgi:hypothetical protein
MGGWTATTWIAIPKIERPITGTEIKGKPPQSECTEPANPVRSFRVLKRASKPAHEIEMEADSDRFTFSSCAESVTDVHTPAGRVRWPV